MLACLRSLQQTIHPASPSGKLRHKPDDDDGGTEQNSHLFGGHTRPADRVQHCAANLKVNTHTHTPLREPEEIWRLTERQTTSELQLFTTHSSKQNQHSRFPLAESRLPKLVFSFLVVVYMCVHGASASERERARQSELASQHYTGFSYHLSTTNLIRDKCFVEIRANGILKSPTTSNEYRPRFGSRRCLHYLGGKTKT